MILDLYPYPNSVNFGRILVGIASVGFGSYTLNAQIATTGAEQGTAPIELSPFTVNSGDDTGYVTNESLSGSRFSQRLDDIPVNISVMTSEMMADLGAFDVQEAMDWSVNAVASGVGDSSGSEATGISDVERFNTNISIRGLNTTTARNFFKWSINSDSFNIERIDSSRGPNALLFGASELAGLNNITTKQANFRDSNKVSYSLDSNGGPGRIALDVNRVLIEDKLAVRLNLFTQDVDQWRDFGNTSKDGAALAATWKLPDDLTLRFDGEVGSTSVISPKTTIRDSTNNWNHYTVAAATVGTNAQKNAANAAAGVALEGVTWTVNESRPDDGVWNWVGQLRSTGTNLNLKPVIDAGLTTGTLYTGVPIDETATPVTNAADAYQSTLLLPDWDYANLAMAGRVKGDHSTYSLFVEKKLTDDLFIELAYNHQNEDRLWHTEDGNPNVIIYDLAKTLPAGYLIDGSNVNPDFGKPFLTRAPSVRETYVKSDEFRALAAYQLRGDWYKLNFGANLSYQKTREGQFRSTLTITNTAETTGIADLGDVANHPRFRTNLSDPSEGITKFTFGETYTIGDAEMEFVQTSGWPHTKQSLMSGMVFMSGSWGRRGRLQTTLGIRRDEGTVDQFSTHVFDPVTGIYQRSDFTESFENKVNSPSYGAVYHVASWLSLYGNYSKSFAFASPNLSFLGTIVPPPIGQSTEFGLRFRLGRKISGSINYYDSEQQNNVVQDAVLINRTQDIYTELGLGEFWRAVDTDILTSTGYEFQVTGNPTKSWTLMANLAFPKSARDNTFMFAYDEWFAKESPAWYDIANDPTNPSSATIASLLQALVNRRATKNVNDGVGSLKIIKMTGSLLTKYNFRNGTLKGLSLGGGVKYRGENNISRDASAQDILVDAYYESTLFAQYGFKWKGLGWRLNLNVTNPFDDLNFRYTTINATTLDGLAYRISTPRSFRLGVDVSF